MGAFRSRLADTSSDDNLTNGGAAAAAAANGTGGTAAMLVGSGELSADVRAVKAGAQPNNGVLGRYSVDLGRLLGEGVFARVYLGSDGTNNGERVAIKAIDLKKVQQLFPDTHELVLSREIATNRKVPKHQGIVQLLHTSSSANTMYLVQEFMGGGHLHSYLQQRNNMLEEKEARRIFKQVADAVAHCHQHGVVHRDLKLENILLDRTKQRAKIADFGLAALSGPDELLTDFPGSPAYAAPELVQGTPYRGQLSDVWALGVLLYVMLHGRFPFWDEFRSELYNQICHAAVPFDPSCKLSPHLTDLLTKMLRKDPAQRITMQDVLKHSWLEPVASSPMRRMLDSPKKLVNARRSLFAGATGSSPVAAS